MVVYLATLFRLTGVGLLKSFLSLRLTIEGASTHVTGLVMSGYCIGFVSDKASPESPFLAQEPCNRTGVCLPLVRNGKLIIIHHESLADHSSKLSPKSTRGRNGFDGGSEAGVAGRGAARPRKTRGEQLVANDYDYALAA